eukprot:TRINITY_DN7597_c0_g1_i6.p1 TRINITY_DN7597_c0_g1~~TRINITY_DN7597_c0_g1_i6.p1  ORF type:complete len:111 (-),score=10.29 TRINITY_DN7597_c0_g1_i6:312-644(-)
MKWIQQDMPLPAVYCSLERDERCCGVELLVRATHFAAAGFGQTSSSASTSFGKEPAKSSTSVDAPVLVASQYRHNIQHLSMWGIASSPVLGRTAEWLANFARDLYWYSPM